MISPVSREAVGIRHVSDAEVEDLYLTVAEEEDVAGLDVPVDDPLLVCVVEARRTPGS